MSLDEPSTQTRSAPPATQAAPASRPSPLRVVVTILVVLLLLGGAVLASYWIQASEPTAQREAATRKSAALVETVVAERGTYTPTLRVLGAVQPAREIVLGPRVGGEIVEVDPVFRPGGRVAAGDPLLRIDPADYANALVMRESEVGQVQAELAIEEGRQRVAELEFELLGEDIDPANRALVLREPQIASLRSKLRAAEAARDLAEVELARTKVAAPFDALILERFVELGSQVSAGDRLARLVGADEYWVVATVPLGAIRRIQFPGDGRPGAPARLHHRAVWDEDQSRAGVVERLIGEVDDSTRLARVIVAVPDPLGTGDEPSLILGTLVQVEIEARPLADVVRVDRAHLRQGNTVWVMDGDELRVRAADVVFTDSRHAYLRGGVEHGERVVVTSLATVVDGLPVRQAEVDVPTTVIEEPER